MKKLKQLTAIAVAMVCLSGVASAGDYVNGDVVRVPEAGATALILAMAMAGIGLGRRYFTS